MSTMGNIPNQPGKASYDKDLQMWQQTSAIDLNKLRFIRYLVERGELEHLPFGPSSGDFQELEETKEAVAP